MNLVSTSTDTLEKRQRPGEGPPTFTFTFASPSSSPLKRAISEPVQASTKNSLHDLPYDLQQQGLLGSEYYPGKTETFSNESFESSDSYSHNNHSDHNHSDHNHQTSFSNNESLGLLFNKEEITKRDSHNNNNTNNNTNSNNNNQQPQINGSKIIKFINKFSKSTSSHLHGQKHFEYVTHYGRQHKYHSELLLKRLERTRSNESHPRNDRSNNYHKTTPSCPEEQKNTVNSTEKHKDSYHHDYHDYHKPHTAPKFQVKSESWQTKSLTNSLSSVKSVLVPVLNEIDRLTSCSKAKKRSRRVHETKVKSKRDNKSAETVLVDCLVNYNEEDSEKARLIDVENQVKRTPRRKKKTSSSSCFSPSATSDETSDIDALADKQAGCTIHEPSEQTVIIQIDHTNFSEIPQNSIEVTKSSLFFEPISPHHCTLSKSILNKKALSLALKLETTSSTTTLMTQLSEENKMEDPLPALPSTEAIKAKRKNFKMTKSIQGHHFNSILSPPSSPSQLKSVQLTQHSFSQTQNYQQQKPQLSLDLRLANNFQQEQLQQEQLQYEQQQRQQQRKQQNDLCRKHKSDNKSLNISENVSRDNQAVSNSKFTNDFQSIPSMQSPVQTQKFHSNKNENFCTNSFKRSGDKSNNIKTDLKSEETSCIKEDENHPSFHKFSPTIRVHPTTPLSPMNQPINTEPKPTVTFATPASTTPPGCFPFRVFRQGRKTSKEASGPSSSFATLPQKKFFGCFATSKLSQKVISAVKPTFKRSHSGTKKYQIPLLSKLGGKESPKIMSYGLYHSYLRLGQLTGGLIFPLTERSTQPVPQKSSYVLPSTSQTTKATPPPPPSHAERVLQKARSIRYRSKLESIGGAKRTRHGTVVERHHASQHLYSVQRSSSIDQKLHHYSSHSSHHHSHHHSQHHHHDHIHKNAAYYQSKRTPATRYFSVDCIDAVELSGTGRLVSRLTSLEHKPANATPQSTQNLFSRQSSKRKKGIKRPHLLTHSNSTVRILSDSHNKVNYNTFDSSHNHNNNYNTFDTNHNDNNNNIYDNNYPIINASDGLNEAEASLRNSESCSSSSSKYVSNETISQDMELQVPMKTTIRKTHGNNSYDNNNNNLFKEQIGSVLKPTDRKLATKFFGNKGGLRERHKKSKNMSWLIHPRSTVRLYWDLLMFCMLLINIIVLPLAISFFTEAILLGVKWILLNCICDVIFLTDILLNFRTGIIMDSYSNTVLMNPDQISRHYLRTWFILDLLSSLPFDVTIVFFTPNKINASHLAYAGRALRIFRLVKLVSLIRLLRLSRLGKYFTRLRVISNFGQLIRVVGRVAQVMSLVFVILVLGHWNGCLQWFVPMLQQYPGDSWAALENLIDSDWLEQYTWALFKALSHMLSIGFGRYPPQSTTDVWLTILSMLTGATCYALFVGQSTTIIQSFGVSKRLYQEKFQKVEEYMSYRNLPRKLRRSISKYYEHRFRGKMFDEPSILAEVNECLHEEIVNFNCRSLISSVSFFETADRSFVTDLVSKLIGEVYLPGNMIVKEGTLGNKMFFLQEGTVSILTKNGKCVAKLYDGSYFGEVCLLRNTRRVASVRADSFCNVFTLAVEHFVSVVDRYPHMREMMETVAKQRINHCGDDVKLEPVAGKVERRKEKSLRKREGKKEEKMKKEKMKKKKKEGKHRSGKNKESIEMKVSKKLNPPSTTSPSRHPPVQPTQPSSTRCPPTSSKTSSILRSASTTPGVIASLDARVNKKNNSFSGGLGIVALKSVGGKLDALTLEALSGITKEISVASSKHAKKTDKYHNLSLGEPLGERNEEEEEDDEDDRGIYFNVKSDTVITTLDVQDSL